MALHPALVMARTARELKAALPPSVLERAPLHPDPEAAARIDAARERVCGARPADAPLAQTALDLGPGA